MVSGDFSFSNFRELQNLFLIHQGIIDSYTPIKQNNSKLIEYSKAISAYQKYCKALPEEIILTMFNVIFSTDSENVKNCYMDNLTKIPSLKGCFNPDPNIANITTVEDSNSEESQRLSDSSSDTSVDYSILQNIVDNFIAGAIVIEES